MLYEALTGRLPFEAAGRPSQVLQQILETPPVRPTAVNKTLDRELETVLLKALEKEKARRYPSVGAFAEDLERYLAGEPILARRPSRMYVLRKRLQRHRIAATVCVGGLLVIAGVAGVRGWWAQRELAAARRAALILQDSLEIGAVRGKAAPAKALHERHPDLEEARLVWAQAQYRQEDLRRGAIVFLEKQVRDDPTSWACAALLAEVCEATTGDVGRAERLRREVERRAPKTAEGYYLRSFATLDARRAHEYAAEAVALDPESVSAWRRLTSLCLVVGDLDRALEGADRLMALGEPEERWVFFKAKVLAALGRFAEAIQLYSEVIESGNRGSTVYRYRAHARRRVGEHAAAVEDYTKAIALAGDASAREWAAFYQRATPLWILGRTDEALEDYRRVRSILGYPFYADARRHIILRGQGRVTEADEILRGALGDVEDHWLRQIFRCLAGQITPEALVADAVAQQNAERLCEAYYYAGETCLMSGRDDEAREWFESCVRTGVEFDPDAIPAVPMNEYELAAWRLETLGAGEPPSTPP
jgi:tetratricopeptide (TPR) repeat protein